jgi:hypothetical protein
VTCTRGASNSNSRGSSTARRERRAWTLETYQANVAVVDPETGEVVATARCYRCGELLTDLGVGDSLKMTLDRIFPGVLGGLYGTVRRDKSERRTNIRPACGPCNESTGGALATRKRRRRG